jgi:hypothetical protein
VVFSDIDDGLRISTGEGKAKRYAAHNDGTALRRAFAASSTVVHRGSLPLVTSMLADRKSMLALWMLRCLVNIAQWQVDEPGNRDVQDVTRTERPSDS